MSKNLEEMLFLSTFLSGNKPLELLKQLISQAISPILITNAGHLDGGYKIIFANRAFCHLTGYQLAELVGASPRMFQGPKSNQETISKLGKSLKETGYFRGASKNYRKDGTCYPLEWDIAPIRDDNGKIQFFISIQRDVSKVVETANHVKNLNENVRQFLTDLNHSKLDAAQIKTRSAQLTAELKENAKLYTQPIKSDDIEDDLFFDIDSESSLLVGGEDKSAISAVEYLQEERYTDEELKTLLEHVDDLKEELEFFGTDSTQVTRLEDIERLLREISDAVFFLVDFTDTALAVCEVADRLKSISQAQLEGYLLVVLKSLAEEIDGWLKQVFVDKTASNIHSGASMIVAAAQQFASMTGAATRQTEEQD